jgi:hypothetical protein
MPGNFFISSACFFSSSSVQHLALVHGQEAHYLPHFHLQFRRRIAHRVRHLDADRALCLARIGGDAEGCRFGL